MNPVRAVFTLTIQLASVGRVRARDQSNNSMHIAHTVCRVVLCAVQCNHHCACYALRWIQSCTNALQNMEILNNATVSTFAFLHFRAPDDNVIKPSVPRLLVASWMPGQH